uniref:Copia protein n=1 Tax=Cajanus cajan TaxID=3821 RepID=A0A151RR82_CAJCA|nr:Copia protein [Cajanus cajan]
MEQPPGMADPQFPNYDCKLQKALYGLKQAPRAWFDRFSSFLIHYGFFCSLADPSLFILHSDVGSLVLLLYVDDILLIGSNTSLVSDFIQLLHAQKQHTVFHSSIEVEYRAMTNTTTELTWLTFILKDLHISLASPPILYCDNISALHMTINPVFHARSRHIELDYHFVRERVSLGFLVTHYIPTNDQVADLFTKPMSKATLMHFQTKLCFQPQPRLREGINRIEMSLDNNYDNHEAQNCCKENFINYGSIEGEILEN